MGLSTLSIRHPDSPWTDGRIAHLRQRWSQGATADCIARELANGISRSAVLAKVHRLGIGRLSPYGGVTGGRRIRSKEREQFTRLTAPSAAGREHLALQLFRPRSPPRWVVEAEPYVDDPSVDADIPPAQRCSLLGLLAGRCRWPVGDPAVADFFFCGGEVLADKPYCGAHWARACAPPLPPPPPGRRRNIRAWR